MKIGILKEIKAGESRVVLTPSEVNELINEGHDVYIESNAGLKAGFSNELYKNAGAKIENDSENIFDKCELIVKVKEISPEEYHLLKPGHIVYACLHPASNKEEVDALLESNVISITAEDTHQHGSPNCEVAGKLGALMGTQYLLSNNGGMGKLVGGVGGVPGINAVVLGGGIVGQGAIDVLSSLKARVTLLDINIGILREIQYKFPNNVSTSFSNKQNIKQLLPNADLVINCTKWPKQRKDHLITRDMLGLMQENSVIVDISADVGGAIETYQPTTLDNPVYKVDGIIHYGVDNIPGAVPNTASIAYAAAIFPHIQSIANHGVKNALLKNSYLCKGLTTYQGILTHEETGLIQKRSWENPNKILDKIN